VFVAHEVLGRSFKNWRKRRRGCETLLSRKRYAVLHLRERPAELKEDFEGVRKQMRRNRGLHVLKCW